MRQQLLGHLGNAAAKLAAREQKEAAGASRFSLGGSGGDKEVGAKASGLTNLCGALLASLQLLASKVRARVRVRVGPSPSPSPSPKG